MALVTSAGRIDTLQIFALIDDDRSPKRRQCAITHPLVLFSETRSFPATGGKNKRRHQVDLYDEQEKTRHPTYAISDCQQEKFSFNIPVELKFAQLECKVNKLFLRPTGLRDQIGFRSALTLSKRIGQGLSHKHMGVTITVSFALSVVAESIAFNLREQ